MNPRRPFPPVFSSSTILPSATSAVGFGESSALSFSAPGSTASHSVRMAGQNPHRSWIPNIHRTPSAIRCAPDKRSTSPIPAATPLMARLSRRWGWGRGLRPVLSGTCDSGIVSPDAEVRIVHENKRVLERFGLTSPEMYVRIFDGHIRGYQAGTIY